MPSLNTINMIINGNYPKDENGDPTNWIECVDGFTMSVIFGEAAYCIPQDNFGPFTHLEVGFPSDRPEPWSVWSSFAEDSLRPTETVYPYVPVDHIKVLLLLHGGEVKYLEDK